MKAVADAALLRQRTSWNTSQVHAPGKVPESPTTPYVVMFGDSGRDELQMNDATAGLGAHRLMPMAVGASEAECDRAVDRITTAFRNHRLVVAGYSTTPCWLESSGNYVYDKDGGGLVSKTLFFTFNLTKE